jgi:Mn2+/Fe2+ NRAMP family transporter
MDQSAPPPPTQPERSKLLRIMGPGLITGASDDDPSGIATYSQVGAQFGYGLAWTLLFSYPLMVAIEEISARIGRVTGYGIAGNLRRHSPRWQASGKPVASSACCWSRTSPIWVPICAPWGRR